MLSQTHRPHHLFTSLLCLPSLLVLSSLITPASSLPNAFLPARETTAPSPQTAGSPDATGAVPISTTMTTMTTAPVAASSSFATRCDYSFCREGQQWCFYWGGMTSYDISLGPVPGETLTILGTCA